LAGRTLVRMDSQQVRDVFLEALAETSEGDDGGLFAHIVYQLTGGQLGDGALGREGTIVLSAPALRVTEYSRVSLSGRRAIRCVAPL
jgi:hypothetical protein